jgi:cell wall-associated NlpC family hydrolase
MKKLIQILLLLFLGITQVQAKNQKKDKLAQVLKSDIKKYHKTCKSPIKEAKKYLGTRYRFGASTKTTKAFDCSSFVKHVIKKSKHKNLPRTASAQASIGKHVNKKNLKPGDLVFFKGTYKRGISHVGIYIGNNKFIHASSGAKRVTISSLSKKYYKRHYAGARRI